MVELKVALRWPRKLQQNESVGRTYNYSRVNSLRAVVFLGQCKPPKRYAENLNSLIRDIIGVRHNTKTRCLML